MFVGVQNLWRRAKGERPGDIELREHITQVADEVKARQTHPAAEPASWHPNPQPAAETQGVPPVGGGWCSVMRDPVRSARRVLRH